MIADQEKVGAGLRRDGGGGAGVQDWRGDSRGGGGGAGQGIRGRGGGGADFCYDGVSQKDGVMEMEATSSSTAVTSGNGDVGFGGDTVDVGDAGGVLRRRLSPAPAPSLACFNSALSACGKWEVGGEGNGETEEEGDKMLERAFVILEAMKRGEGGAPSPDAVSYKEIVNACGR